MKYILKSSKEIFITYILNYLLIIISGLIYNLFGYNNIDLFINNILPYILILFYILTIIYLYLKNYQKENKLPLNQYYPLISLGISLAVFFNMLIFLIITPQASSSLPLLITIISSCIIGPIYEEILFRYLLYNRLKNKYSTTKSLLITTTIFALIHIYPIKIIYAFILGIIINIFYEKNKNILAPILIHIAANTIVIFLHEYNIYILLLSLINIIISIKIVNIKL